LNNERVLKALVNLGLSKTDAQVYVHLATMGPKKAKNIADTLRLHKQQLYRSLKNLQCKGCVKATLEHSALFSATPPEKILETLIKSKMKEAQNIQQNKQELLSIWQSMTTDDSTN
jgi:sugar-specific transcriptional regulator TrmB